MTASTSFAMELSQSHSAVVVAVDVGAADGEPGEAVGDGAVVVVAAVAAAVDWYGVHCYWDESWKERETYEPTGALDWNVLRKISTLYPNINEAKNAYGITLEKHQSFLSS